MGGWNLAGLAFGIDGGSILDDLKVSGLPRSQGDLAIEPAFEFFRQTGGLGVVISDRAVKDLNIHEWSSLELSRDAFHHFFLAQESLKVTVLLKIGMP